MMRMILEIVIIIMCRLHLSKNGYESTEEEDVRKFTYSPEQIEGAEGEKLSTSLLTPISINGSR